MPKIELPESKIDRSKYFGSKELTAQWEALRDAELDAAGVPLPPIPDVSAIPKGCEILMTPIEARRRGRWEAVQFADAYGQRPTRTVGNRDTQQLNGWVRHDRMDAWGHVETHWSHPGTREFGTEVRRQDFAPPTSQDTLLTEIPKRFASRPWVGADMTGDRAKAIKTVQRWVQKIVAGESLSLWLGGQPGRGKTQMAYWAMLELAAHEIPVERHDMADIVRQLRLTYDAERQTHARIKFEDSMAKAETARVLILDDVGVEISGDDVRAILHRLVDYRWEHELPTLVTSNFTPAQLGDVKLGVKRVDERIVSRFSSYYAVTVGGPDFRQKAV